MPVGETRLGKPVPGPPGPAFPILRGPAFDHGRLAEVLREARWDSVTAVTLPFSRFEYTEDEGSIEFTLEDSTWVCGLDDYACENTGPASPGPRMP